MSGAKVRLSRRRMLKLVGIGAGAVALGACGATPAAPTATSAPEIQPTNTPVPAAVEEPTATSAPAETIPATPTPAAEVITDVVADTVEAGQAAYGGGYEPKHAQTEVALLVWGIPGDETDPWVRAMRSGVRRFGEAYPEIKVTWEPIAWTDLSTKVNAAVAAKQGPDILFEADKEGEYPRNRVVRPITEEVLPADFIAKHRFYEVRPLDDGYLYWVHCAVMAPHLFANKALLDEAGVSVADVPATWNEFCVFAQELTKFENDQMVQAGFGINGYASLMWDDLMYQQKAHIYSPKKSFVNTPESVNAWQFILDIYDQYKINDRNFLDYQEGFGTGKAAFMYCWTWITFSLEANYPDVEWVPVMIPTFTGEGPYARFDYDGPGWMVTTLAEGDRLPAAWELFKFHVHDYQYLVERSHSTGMMLSSEPHPNYDKMFAEVQEIEDPSQEQRRMQSLAVLAKQFEGGMVFPGEFTDPFYRMLNGMHDGIVLNDRPIAEVLADYEQQFDEILATTNFWITPEA